MKAKIQWNREELKKRSRAVLHTHYWRIVFITVLLSLLFDSGSIVSGTIHPFFNKINQSTGTLQETSAEERIFPYKQMESWLQKVKNIFEREKSYRGIAFLGIVIMALVVLTIILSITGILIEIFIINPIYVGAMRFYIRSFDTTPRFKEIFHAFENRYKNVVGIMLLRDLYTILWALLFIIPGIVKSYEYSMVPYLLAESPGMKANEAFAISRQMMDGQKWKAFVLDLSFLGWEILSVMTFGILGFFFVTPYNKLTSVALYRRLRGADEIPANVYYAGMEHDTMQGWYGRY